MGEGGLARPPAHRLTANEPSEEGRPVHRRSLIKLVSAALVALAAATASAAPRDAAATKKIDEAINTHYLATDFDKAEAVLTGTINACGDKCSPAVVAKAWMYVGIVRGSGKNDLKGAKEAFQKAVAADSKVALDDALATPETKKAFLEVQGAGAAGTGGTTGSGGEAGSGGDGGKKKPPKGEDVAGAMECLPKVTEVQTRRPIPISCTTEEEAVKAELKYKEFGGESWKTVKMSKKGDAFQAEIPCSATQLAGTLRFYVRAQDAAGDTVDTHGSKSKPVEIAIVPQTDQEAPAYPDKDPPARCAEQEECPPDFPGCKKAGGGTKGWGSSCASSDECQSGLSCVHGTCDQGQSCDIDADCPGGVKCVGGKCEAGGPSGPYKKNWLGLHAAYDFAIVGGDEVCSKDSQDNKGFACFYPGTENQYSNVPQKGKADKIATGFSPATARVMLSFDRVLTPNVTLGARFGYAFGGGPPAGKNKDVKFLPFHAEVRVGYWIGQDVFAKKGIRPYLGVGGGMAQVDAKLPVTVIDCGPQGTACGTAPQQLDAYKKLGQSFVALHGGAMYALSQNGGFLLNLNLMYMLPTTGQVIEPSIGYVFGM
jgi:hypothetical protein